MQKKLFGILLVLCMMFAVLGITAAATDYYVDETLTESGDGTTAETAFATFNEAITAADTVVTEDNPVTVHIIGTAAVGAAYNMPEYEGTIKIVGEDGTTPTLSFGGSATQFYSNGSLEFENIAFDNGGTKSSNRISLVAQNNKLVLGSGLTMSNASVCVVGGYFQPTSVDPVTINSDITVLSGSYDIVTGGSFHAGASSIDTKVTSADINIVIGSANNTVTINRFGPFGVWGNIPYNSDSEMNATVTVAGAVTVTGWYTGVIYFCSADYLAPYNVDLIIQGDISVAPDKIYVENKAYTLNYNVYYDTRVATAAEDADLFTSGTGTYTFNVIKADYTVYCENNVGHTYENGECTNCGAVEPNTGAHGEDTFTWEIVDGKMVFTCAGEGCGATLASVTPTAETVYVSANGITLANDVTDAIGTTPELAFADFDLAMQYAALAATEGKTVTVTVVDTIEIADNNAKTTESAYTMPEYAGTVKIVGAEGAKLTFGAEYIYLNGSLEISNIEFGNTAKRYLVAQSNKLVLGEGITNTSSSYLVYVIGDCYGTQSDVIASDITIRSGIYNLVTGGTFNNTDYIKGTFNITVGKTNENDTLVIDRFAPFSVYRGRPSEDLAATVKVDGGVTVNTWFVDRILSATNDTEYEYFVDLYLNGDITAGNENMFARGPKNGGGLAGTKVTYNIYSDTITDETIVADVALFTGLEEVVTEESVTSTVIVNVHNTAAPAGYTMAIADGVATFTCACGCETVLAEHDTLASTIYVSENGVSLANGVSDKIGTTAGMAFADFDMAMEYAAKAAAAGVTVTVNVIGKVAVNCTETAYTSSTYYVYAMPEYAGTVKIVGVNTDVTKATLNFGGTANAALLLNGALEVEGITLDNNATDNKIHIFAQNNKLVLGNNITKGNATIYVYGGFCEPTEENTVDGDVTIRSGSYAVVTAGSRGKVNGTAVLVTGGNAKLTFGAPEGQTLTISRVAPFGVYESLLKADAYATVKIDDAVEISSDYHLAVMYGLASEHSYNVDLILRDVPALSKASSRSNAFTVNYNIYYDAEVDGTKTAAENFSTLAVTPSTGSTVISKSTDTYYNYCADVLEGHFITDTEYKCDSCTECGYTYHAAKADAVWEKVSDNEYTFTCACGEEILTSATPYVYVGGYTVETVKDETTGATTYVSNEYTSGAVDGLGTSESPVTTIREAVRRMAGTGGKVILTADRDIFNDISFTTPYSNLITFTAENDEAGEPYGFKCVKVGACFNMNGPTKFENISFDMPGTGSGITDGEEWTLPMTLVFAAHWNDLTFGDGITTLGRAYVVAGTNRLSYDTNDEYTFVDGVYTDDAKKDCTITLNKVTERADETGTKSLFYAGVYLGDRINNITAHYALANKNVTAIFNDAQCGYIYSCTTSGLTYAATGDDDGEGDGSEDGNTDTEIDSDGTGDGTTEGDTSTGDDTTNGDTTTGEGTTDGTTPTVTTYADIVTLTKCTTTLIFNDGATATALNSGSANAYSGTTSLDTLNIYLNDNSTIGTNNTNNTAFILFNVKNLNIYVSDVDGEQEWDGEGTRSLDYPLVQRIHASMSKAYIEALDDSTEHKVYINYSAHGTEVYPRVNYNYTNVVRDYTGHTFVYNGTDFVCSVEGCGKTMAEAAMSPVVITAKPVAYDIENGTVTVQYIYSYTNTASNIYTASNGLKYDICESINTMSFEVAATDGFTLDKLVAGTSFPSTSTQNNSWRGVVDGNKITVTYINSHDDITNNKLIATATFKIDDMTKLTDGAYFYADNVAASRLNTDYEIEPAVVYGMATTSYKQSFYLGVTLLSEYVLEYVVSPISGTTIDDCWMVFEKTNATGATTTTTVYPYADESGMWRFSVPGIAAKEMNDTVKGKLGYISTNSETNIETAHISTARTYNLVSYYNVIAPTAAENLKAVLDAMFYYGALAQTQFNYNTANPVTNALSGYTAPNLANVTVEKVEAVKGEGTYDYMCSGQDAVLEQRIGTTLYYTATNTDATGLTFKGEYKNINGSTIKFEVSGEDIFVSGGKLCVYVDDIAAKDLRAEFTGALYDSNGNQVSNTITTGFEVYAYTAITNNEAHAELCKAILAYSDAAAAYLKLVK